MFCFECLLCRPGSSNSLILSWLLVDEAKLKDETLPANGGIKSRIRALRAGGATVPAYLKNHLRCLDRSLNQMRSVAVYYKEYSSIENLQLLGSNYIVNEQDYRWWVVHEF